jgi:hypothetical protein
MEGRSRLLSLDLPSFHLSNNTSHDGILSDLKNVSAGPNTMTGPINCASLESLLEYLPNDTSLDGGMHL